MAGLKQSDQTSQAPPLPACSAQNRFSTLKNLQSDPKSPFFYVSAQNQPFDEAFSPFLGGMFQLAPTPVSYKQSFTAAEVLLAVTGHASLGPPCLPPEVVSTLAEANITDYSWSWLISDVTCLLTSDPQRNDSADSITLNLCHHAWYFAENELMQAVQGRRIEVPLQTGIFTFSGSNVRPYKQFTCMPFQCLDTIPVTVHPLKGRQAHGLCCSPNNARFEILLSRKSRSRGRESGISNIQRSDIDSGGEQIAWYWSIGRVRAREGLPEKACVVLHWVVYQESAQEVQRLTRDGGTVCEVVDRLGSYGGAGAAARGLFGGEGKGPGGFESGPRKCERMTSTGADRGRRSGYGNHRRGGRGGRW